MVEWLGADAFVHFEMDINNEDQSFALPEEIDRNVSKEGKFQGVARIDPSHLFERGSTLRLKPDTGKLHIFDPESGVRLSRSQPISEVEKLKSDRT